MSRVDVTGPIDHAAEVSLLVAATDEALARYDGDVDQETGASVDDWGFSVMERNAFVAGALFAEKFVQRSIARALGIEKEVEE